MKKKVKEFLSSQEGATSIEYALISGMIFLVIILAVSNLGGAVHGLYQSIAAAFP